MQGLVFRRCTYRGHAPVLGPYIVTRLDQPSSRDFAAADEVILEERRCRCGAVRRQIEISREPISEVVLPGRMADQLRRVGRLEIGRSRHD